MYWILLVIIPVTIGMAVWASADISSGIYLKTRCRGEKHARQMALTFDDGPAETTGKVLDILKSRGIRATFFLIGEQAARHPELVRRMIEEGHVIGCHSYTHSFRFPLSSEKRVEEELVKTRKTLQQITGKRVLLFRPPFGVTNPNIGRAVRKTGYTAVGWSVRSFDTLSGRSREKVERRVTERLHPGGIVLLHDRLPDAESVTLGIIDRIGKENYTLTTVDRLLNINAYENE